MNKHFLPARPEDEEKYAGAIRLFWAMDRLRSVWDHLHLPPPLKRSELEILGTAARLEQAGQNEVTMGRLARETGRSLPGVSQKISELEKRGYVRRTGHKEDRRVVGVELTRRGKDLTRRALEEYLGSMERALEHMGNKKTEGLLASMEALSESLEWVQRQQEGEVDDH